MNEEKIGQQISLLESNFINEYATLELLNGQYILQMSNCKFREIQGDYNDGNHEFVAIVIHGWKSRNYNRIRETFQDAFSSANIDTYYYTLPHHMGRQESSSFYSGELMISANVERTLYSVYQALVEINALINSLSELYPNSKICLIGISLGGLLANLCVTKNKNIHKLISICPVNNLSYEVWNSKAFLEIKSELQQHNITYEQLNKHWDVINPCNYIPVIATENILLINSLYDLFVPIEDANDLLLAWSNPKRILYKSGHSALELKKKTIRNDVMNFLTFV
ncbi:MAG: prolyl oligopeptidase family serine peptidase [Oscillospiraceae bacterium]|jgi:hypothetical protein|nr:prolyl oligopeptidase family serine peptidase [Oscillospiraceae bacterium]